MTTQPSSRSTLAISLGTESALNVVAFAGTPMIVPGEDDGRMVEAMCDAVSC
jgi:hypothetical protein